MLGALGFENAYAGTRRDQAEGRLAANDSALRRAFEPLINPIPAGLMRAASQRVARKDDPEPPVVTARWLGSRLLAASR